MKKVNVIPKFTLSFIWSDGHVENVIDDAPKIRLRFQEFVSDAVKFHLDGIKEVQLIDNRNIVWKSYRQNY